MAASVRSKLKLGISECRCVASPAPARAYVPARGSPAYLTLCFTSYILFHVTSLYFTLLYFTLAYFTLNPFPLILKRPPPLP